MTTMARREVTLSEWAEMIGVPVGTVRQWSKTRPGFPAVVRRIGTADLRYLSDLTAWRKRPDNSRLGQPRGGWKKAGE